MNQPYIKLTQTNGEVISVMLDYVWSKLSENEQKEVVEILQDYDVEMEMV